MSGTTRRQFKICLIGEGYVGKTSARRKFLDKSFKTNYIPTLGVDFARKTVRFEQFMADLIIWDIAGQPLFANLRKRYYDGAHGLVLVYSVVNRESFENARQWLVEAKGYMGNLPPVIIVGNKLDLRARAAPEDIVKTNEGVMFTEDISLEMRTPAYFIETSALTGENIDKAFTELTKMMLGLDPSPARPEPQPTPSPSTTVDLADSSSEETAYVAPAESHAAAVSENDTAVKAVSNEARAIQPTLDPVTSMEADAGYAEAEQVGEAMSHLVSLRKELSEAEEAMSNEVSEIEKQIVTLKNTVHVKKIMYEHLKQQLATTRQEWSDAYEEYSQLDQKKKQALERRSKQIEDIRARIDLVGREIRGQVDELDLKRMREKSKNDIDSHR